MPSVGKMSRGIVRRANVAPRTRPAITTRMVTGRRSANRTKFIDGERLGRWVHPRVHTWSRHSLVLQTVARQRRTRSAIDSSLLPCEVVIQGLEDGRALRQTSLIVRARHRDSRDEMINSSGLWPGEFGISEVDVVDDLRDASERGVVEAKAAQQHFKGALVPLVGELRREHVKAYFMRSRLVALGRHETELGIFVDEATNEPAACDSVDVESLPSDPGSSPEAAQVDMTKGCGRLCPSAKMGLESADKPLRGFPARRPEEIDGDHLGNSSTQAGHLSSELRSPLFGERPLPRELPPEATGGLRDLHVVGVPRTMEVGDYLGVVQALEELRLAKGRLAAVLRDLANYPL